MAPKYEVETLPENIVGTSLPVQVKIFPATAFHTLDWVGIYPLLTPTAPGLSLARWTYLGQGKKAIKDNTAIIDFTLPVSKIQRNSEIMAGILKFAFNEKMDIMLNRKV